ncbi:MAG: type I restriction-modification enzyme R subunit C-terminal domain-containing protein [Dermatophilaceae bacterium]
MARTGLVAGYLSRVMGRDPTARMIVFCVDLQHADDMRRALVNANPHRVAADPEWVVRIVGTEEDKDRVLEEFTDPERSSPVVATTSRLLSTGIDIEDLRYVVLFRPVGSRVEFTQIIGRGTRLYPDKGKTSFEVVDFVGATAHFADPEFDGFPSRTIVDPDGSHPDTHPDEADSDGGGLDAGGLDVAEPEPPFEAGNPAGPDDGPPPDGGPPPDDLDAPGPIGRPGAYVVDDGAFLVVAEALQVPDTSTGRLVLTEYGQHVAGAIRRVAPTPVELAERWSSKPARDDVLVALADARVDVEHLVADGAESRVDLLDVLLQLAWNLAPRTRAERARQARTEHRTDLEERSEVAREVLSALLDRYAEHGIDDVTSPEVAWVPPLSSIGTPRAVAEALGDGGLHRAVDEVQRWLYSSRSVS